MKLKERTKQAGATGYILLWLLVYRFQFCFSFSFSGAALSYSFFDASVSLANLANVLAEMVKRSDSSMPQLS
jgi:hypothetical protein